MNLPKLSPNIIGISGPSKVGKGILTSHILEFFGGDHLSVRDYITTHFNDDEKNMPDYREAMIAAGNRIRQENGTDYIIKELYFQALKSKKGAIIESVRNPMEAKFLKDHNCILLGIYAPTEKIIENIKNEIEDKTKLNSTIDVVREQINREMYNPDPTKQNISECLKMCNLLLYNNSTKEDLFRQVDFLLPQLLERFNSDKERRG